MLSKKIVTLFLTKIASIDECNFIYRVLYKDCFWLFDF